MGLEAATFIQSLVATNPVATDKKNQGDDHLRLLKSVLQGTFPNATRPLYFPSNTVQASNYTAVEADDGKVILCPTGGGAFTITLPTPSYSGWSLTVVKAASDVNPVYIVPPSGTFNGLYAKLRCNVPYTMTTVYYAGASGFFRMRAPGEVQPGAIEWFAGPTAIGYQLCNGASLVRLDCPELFAAIGTSYGAADGTHFNVPNILDRFPVGAGSSYSFGSVGGEATHALSIAEMPVHQITGAVGSGGVDHTHPDTGPAATNGQFSGLISNNNGWMGDPTTNNSNTGNASSYLHTHPFAADPIGSGTAHENRPPYMALFPLLRLC